VSLLRGTDWVFKHDSGENHFSKFQQVFWSWTEVSCGPQMRVSRLYRCMWVVAVILKWRFSEIFRLSSRPR